MSSQSTLESAFDRVETLARGRGLENVVRATYDGTPALTVDGRAFVRLLDERTLLLQCPLEQKVLLMEISPEIYFETDDFIGADAILVHLDAIDDEELGIRLEDAWCYKAPAA